MTVSATVGGISTLVVHDRRFRVVSRAVIVVLAAAWLGYFTAFRTPVARIALEVGSVAALLGGIARVTWLVRREGMPLPMPAPLRRASDALLPAFASPAALMAKTWLAAMVVMEWRGKAHFTATEYAIVGAVLAAILGRGVLRARRARPRFDTLETLASRTTAPACPLGFGCTPTRSTSAPAGASGLLDAMVASPEISATAYREGSR